MNELADRVRHERLKRGWSVRAASVEGGISNTWWARFEDYLQPLTPQIAAAVAKAFGWPDDWASEPPTYADGREVVLSDAYIDRLTDVISRRAIGALAEQLRELSENLRAVMGRIERLERRGGEHGAR